MSSVLITAKLLTKGLLTFTPVYRYLHRQRAGGDSSARYCYCIWLRHLTTVCRATGMKVPATVAELGPGESVGTGIAALLSGVSNYHSLDVAKYFNVEKSLAQFDELVTLFKARADIPDEKEYSQSLPFLPSYKFPSDILPEEWLERCLAPERLERIRAAILSMPEPHGNATPEISIRHFAPWNSSEVIQPETVDFIFSQAVLEHVDDLPDTYRCMNLWLKPGGVMSHTIDFESHNLTEKWNGHWAYSNFIWKIIRGKRAYLLNRQPFSANLALLHTHRYRIGKIIETTRLDGLPKSKIANDMQYVTEKDLATGGAYILSLK